MIGHYWSASRKEWVDVTTMADKHLCNAYRKMQTDPLETAVARESWIALEGEMERRGLDAQYPNGKPPEPEPPPADEDYGFGEDERGGVT